jgi:hypothetical protein
MVTKRSIRKELLKLLKAFFRHSGYDIAVRCTELYNAYNPLTDEVTTYRYKVQILIKDKVYIYDGWCYPEDLDQIAFGIFSHWLLKNNEIYDGPSSAFYNMYVCRGNIVSKED